MCVLQYLSSYALFPLAMAIGTPLDDCRRVAELLGIKLFINEFVSYTQLNSLIENRHLLTTHLTNNGSFLWEENDVILLNSTSAHVLQGGVMTVCIRQRFVCRKYEKSKHEN